MIDEAKVRVIYDIGAIAFQPYLAVSKKIVVAFPWFLHEIITILFDIHKLLERQTLD